MGSSKHIEDLAQYVRRVRTEKGLSTTDVENNSSRKISDAYVTQIENRRVKNVSPEKLQALAKGLRVPEDEVFAVARGKALADPSTFQGGRYAALFDSAEQLTPEQLVKFNSIMEIAEREVAHMLEEDKRKSKKRA